MSVDKLYSDLYAKKVFTLDEVVEALEKLTQRNLSRSYINSQYLDSMIKNKKFARARHGLFVAMSPNGMPEVDKLLLASKVRKRGFLGFHSALEFYGCAYSATNNSYLCVEANDRFNAFKFGGYSFKPVYVKNSNFEVVQQEYQGHLIRVSGKERLFLDSISRPKYAEGWEECLKSLEGLGGLDFEKLYSILYKGYGGQTAVRRAGFVLELLRESSVYYQHLSENILTSIESLVGKGKKYIIPGKGGRLVKRWGLIIPNNFRGLLTAV
jgi:predicted transcriptional regulator of viral defense system